MSKKERRAQLRREEARLSQESVRKQNIRTLKLVGSALAVTGAGFCAVI